MLFLKRAQGRKNPSFNQAITETLESRRMLCSDDALANDSPTIIDDFTSPTWDAGATDHNSSWYVPEDIVSIDSIPSSFTSSQPVGAFGASDPGGSTPFYPTSFSVNAAGLPLLTSRADGTGLKIFLDFDGHGTNLPFGIDTDDTTFNAAEQAAIYDTWRDITSYFSALNVNITTVQPPTGASDPNFAWHLTSKSISGGYAYVGVLTKSQPYGFNQADNAVSRRSGIAHEIGHLLGLQHQSEYDKLGNKTAEYSDGWDNRSRTVIGIDYNTNIRQWFYGRNANGVTVLQDDLQTMANTVKSVAGGDGFRTDDFGNTIATAYAIPSTIQRIEGFTERYTDADVFSFTVPSTQRWNFAATPTFESAAEPKLELLDSAGNVLNSADSADQRSSINHNAVEFSRDLPAGNYYVRVSSSGDISELGEYTLTASPFLSGWNTQDIGSLFRPGTASYDPVSGKLVQLGGGTDIWSTSDQFRFTYNVLNGDGSITARVDSLDNVDPYAKAGLMIRETLANNAKDVLFDIKPSGELETIQRATGGASATNIVSTTGQVGPWLKLSRAANLFTLQKSVDGSTWINVATTTVAMTTSVYIGFATNARNARYPAYSSFSNLSFTGSIGAAAPTYNALPAPTGLTAAPASGANSSIVLNWSDIAGETGYLIERSVDGVTFSSLTSVGADVVTYTDANAWGSMRWYYRVSAKNGLTNSVPSDVISTVNKPRAVSSPAASYALPSTSTSTSAIQLNWSDVQGDEGYKVERSTDNVTYTLVTTRPANYNAYNDSGLVANTVYYYRITPVTSIGDGVAPSFTIIAATRLANVSGFAFTTKTPTSLAMSWTDMTGETGYRLEKSVDGATWATAATLAANATSWSDSSLTSVSEYYYRIVALNSSTGLDSAAAMMIMTGTPSITSLPAMWQEADVGSVAGGGVTSSTSGTWKMISSGSDISGTSDSFHFTYVPLTTDATIITRVDSLEATTTAAKAGLMIRQDLTAGSKFAAIMINAGSTYGIDIRRRTTAGTQYTYTQALASVLPPYYLKLQRSGTTINLSYSSDGVTYTATTPLTIGFTGTFYVGLCATANSTTLLNTASFSNVSMTAAFPSTISGSATADIFTFKRNGANLDFWYGPASGAPFYESSYSSLPTLTVTALAGNDLLVIDQTAGEAVPASGMSFDGGADIDTVNVRGNGLSDPYTLSSASIITHNSATNLTRTNTETVKLQNGNFTVASDQQAINLQFDTAQSIITQSQNLATLSLVNSTVNDSNANTIAPALVAGNLTLQDSTLSITPGGTISGVSKFNSLAMIGNSRLDLHDNDLIIDYGASGSPYSILWNYLKTGISLLGGNGYGIGSTEVDQQSIGGTMLGMVDNGSVSGAITSLSGYTNFSANSILIKYTWLGDSNLDGRVDASDYALVDSGFINGGNTGWVFGDYDYSGTTDGSDYALIDSGFVDQNIVL